MTPIPPLRRYQLEPLAAILAAAEAHDAGIIVVRMSRQAGKNEVSARAEAHLLHAYRERGGSGVKAAPTQRPQAVRSRDRLARHLRALGFVHPQLKAGSDTVTLGEASFWYGSGEPGANVVGGTASLLLEFDEAQDFDTEKHDKDYRPMASSTAAATVYWGTALTMDDLLEKTRQAALAEQRRDGVRRVFDVPWARVAEEVPAYGLFIAAERRRMGHTPATPHPIFMTQYELVTVAGAGRLFNPAQLALLRGEHPAAPAPVASATYVFGLDVAGANLSGARDPDWTVLTIARATYPGRGRRDSPAVAIVGQAAWRAADETTLRSAVMAAARRWRPSHITVDATGIGEPLAVWLLQQFGERKVTALKLTSVSKSALGYELISAVNSGALKIWSASANDADHQALWHELVSARAELQASDRMTWGVPESDGHDDRLISMALAMHAATRGRPRVATVT